jgi:hypothetical protein
MAGVVVLRKRHEEREQEQIAAANLAARARMAAMRAGEILPISRQTEEVVDLSGQSRNSLAGRC